MGGRASDDVYGGPLPASAWAADELARGRGRVQIFNATRPGGLDGWTMDVEQYDLVRAALLAHLREHGGGDGTVLLKDATADVQEQLGQHAAFPGGRLTNYVRYVKVDLEARGEVARVPGSSPQRIRLAAPRAQQV